VHCVGVYHLANNLVQRRIKSQLLLENKVLMYKAIMKPIWTYGVQL